MEDLFKIINNPYFLKKFYIVLIFIGIGFISNFIKRVKDEINRKD